MNNNQSTLKLGFWSAIISLSTFIAYVICFAGILSTSEVFLWSNYENYLEYINENNQLFKHLAQFCMLIFGISYLIIIASLVELAENGKRILANLSLYFAIIFVAFISLHYFIQISTVRLQLSNGDTEGLLQFIQGNPISASSSINMLGWTIFFGLSCLFIVPIFEKEKLIRIAFLVNGISCLTGGVSFIFQIDIITLICMNMVMGVAVILFSIGLIKYFKNI
ncbi:hypothetical protein ACFLTE_03090 [Bacteroidota bacterium]